MGTGLAAPFVAIVFSVTLLLDVFAGVFVGIEASQSSNVSQSSSSFYVLGSGVGNRCSDLEIVPKLTFGPFCVIEVFFGARTVSTFVVGG